MNKYIIKSCTIIIMLIAGFLLAGCFSSGHGENSAPVSLQIRDLPASIGEISLEISADDMDTVSVEDVDPLTGSVTVEVPAGLARTFSMTVTPAGAGPVISYSGEATEDLTAGEETEITITLKITETKLLIPDYEGKRVVQKTSFTSTDWVERKGTSLGFGMDTYFMPTDVDIDRYGNIYIASTGDTDSGIHKLESMLDPTPEKLTNAYVEALTIDRTNNLLYYADNAGLMYKCDLQGTLLQSYTLSMGDVTGLAYGDGYVYILDRDSGDQETLHKYDPSGTGTKVDQYYNDPYLKYFSNIPNMDVMYKDGSVYVSSADGADGYKILKFNTNLELIDHFGTFPSDESNPVPGELYHPSRFVAVLNRKITVIDESEYNFPLLVNRLVSFSDLLGSEWETYGTPGTGVDQFTFFNYY